MSRLPSELRRVHLSASFEDRRGGYAYQLQYTPDSDRLSSKEATRGIVEAVGRTSTKRSSSTVGFGRIFDLFRETRRLTDGTYFSELRWALADGDHAVAVYRASGLRLGRELDIDQVLLIHHRDGRWVEITAVPTDPPAFERFWAE
jgi:hypothetical protein